MKGAWMHVVTLRGAIFGLIYGVLGKTPLYLAVKVSFRVAREEITKNTYFFNLFYLLDSYNESFFRGQKTGLDHAQIGLL